MSYTHQEIVWSKLKREPDSSIYGDQVYGINVSLKARKQPANELVRTSSGREVYYKNTYYIDPKQYPEALKIERLDKLDGDLVEDIYIMNTLAGKPKMIRVRTI
jgi:hypothetical protein